MALNRVGENENGFTFYWKIKHFSLLALSGVRSYFSPVFRIPQIDKTEWGLFLQFERGEENFVAFDVYRKRVNDRLSDVFVNFTFFFMQADGYRVIQEIENLCFSNDTHGFVSDIFFRESELFLPDDTLTVGCFIKEHSVNVSESERVESVECTACTEMTTEKISFQIPFSLYQSFKIDTLSNTSLSKKYSNLKINFHPSYSPQSSHLTLIKIERARSSSSVLAKCKLSVVDAKSETVFVIEDRHRFQEDRYDESWDLTNSVSSKLKTSNLEKISGFVLYGELVVSDETRSSRIENLAFSYPALIKTPSIPTNYSLKDKLKCLYADSRLCDFTLKVEGEEFRIHKAVLGAVSPVFCAMFQLEMKERESSASVIKDIDANIMKKLINYAYSERVEDLQWESASKLYVAADKYEILELKELCAKYLTDNLTIGNVTEVLMVSDMHQDRNLEKAAGDFVFAHVKEIFKSEKWKTFVGSNMTIANKILQEICIKLVSRHNI